MAYLLDIDTALSTIRRAFDPLACRAEVYDQQTRVRFRVFDPNGKPVLDITDLFVTYVLDLQNLRVEIQSTRETIERRGFKLKTWSCP